MGSHILSALKDTLAELDKECRDKSEEFMVATNCDLLF